MERRVKKTRSGSQQVAIMRSGVAFAVRRDLSRRGVSKEEKGRFRFQTGCTTVMVVGCGNTITGYPLPSLQPISIENNVDISYAISTFCETGVKVSQVLFLDSCPTERRAGSKGSSELCGVVSSVNIEMLAFGALSGARF